MAKNLRYKGLTDAQVAASREKHGANVLTPPAKPSLWRLFFEKFADPLIIILMVIGVFAIGVSSYEYWGLKEGLTVFFEPIGIFVAILLATGLGFYFELKAQKEFSVLNQQNDHELVAVIRNGNVEEVPKCDVVVGDVLVLQTGQEIPADARLLRAVSLHVDESSLTGEPVHAKTTIEADFDHGATYPSNMVYRGTQIMEGHGYAEVVAVGDMTENGKIMQSLVGNDLDDEFDVDQLDEKQKRALHLRERNKVTRRMKTPLDEQLGGLGKLISNLSYVFAGGIIVGKLLVYFEWKPLAWIIVIPVAFFFWLVIRKFPHWSKWKCLMTIIGFFVLFIGMVVFFHDQLNPDKEMSHLMAYSLNTIMIAVTLVVVAVPEGLPMAISLSLANSMRKMLKTNNLVRKMHACETMGAATVICTDKTGTLTQNLMQVKASMLIDSPLVAEGMAVNATASLDFSKNRPHAIGNPTEGALLLWLFDHGHDYRLLREGITHLAEIPFSTERKYMATLVESGVMEGKRVLYVKGAPEIVLGMSEHFVGPHTKADYEATVSGYQEKGMRTLGFAYQIVDDEEVIGRDGLTAHNLCFMGVVGIEDPVREDVKAAMEECVHAGIDIKIVTGDNMATAREIGRQIGIWHHDTPDEDIIDGRTFAALSKEELLQRVDHLKIIARARPMDKKRLVEALQALNHVVAVTGDGTNDAPALNVAHVGLSMGSGTSVAKEASDITIIDNSFASIARAVKWGRSLYQNIQRFLLFQLTVNVAACLLVLCGAFMGTDTPLTVTQMLWVNLIMDTFAAFALSALPPTDRVMNDKPRDRKAFILDRSMLENILGVGIFFFVLLVALLFVFQHTDTSQLSDLLSPHLGSKRHITPYEQTLIFTIFVMAHFWYLFNARGYKSGGSGLNLKGCDGFITIAVIVFLGQVAIVELPLLNRFFNVVPLSLTDWLIIVLSTSLVMVIRELYSWAKRKLKSQ